VRALAFTLAAALPMAARPAEARQDDGERPQTITEQASRSDHKIRPFLSLVGGGQYETLQPKPGDDRQDRAVTLALSRVGLLGELPRGFSIESEFELNAGPHGTSVWEGQAAIQVRNQLVRFQRRGIRVDLGRMTDDSSLDFFSAHVLDQLLTDSFTRPTLLASGFNRGQGVMARYEVLPGLHPGLTVNMANPTSTTASLVLGGTYAPFSRFYFAPHQQVGRDASKFPADEYHIIVVTPSLVYRSAWLEAQTALQVFRADTNTSSTKDQPIDGYNVRAGLAVSLLGGHLRPFANVSFVQNEVVDADDGTRLSGDLFNGMTLSGGVDVNIAGGSGFGAQYGHIAEQQGFGPIAKQHYVNLGGTLWLSSYAALGARFAIFLRCDDDGRGCQQPEGARALFTTLRIHL